MAKEVQRPCGRSKELEEGLWAGAQGAKEECWEMCLEKWRGQTVGALWTMLGTLSFLLSEMEPQENSEQGRDEPDSGVHWHLLRVGAGGSREHRKKEAAMAQVSAAEGGQD